MNGKLLFLALLAPLAGCDWGQQPPPPPRRPPPVVRPVDRGPNWLDPVPYCEGALRRGEWLVCDNKGLNWLHRTLAGQWAEERQGADRQRLWVQRQQLQALLSERDACQTAECVATAYRRYLKAPPRGAQPPEWRPAPSPRPIHYRPREKRWNWRDNGPSCASKIGWQKAALLARQCAVVNPDGQCGPQRGCETLKTMILDGCWDMGDRRPGFCNRPGSAAGHASLCYEGPALPSRTIADSGRDRCGRGSRPAPPARSGRNPILQLRRRPGESRDLRR